MHFRCLGLFWWWCVLHYWSVLWGVVWIIQNPCWSYLCILFQGGCYVALKEVFSSHVFFFCNEYIPVFVWCVVVGFSWYMLHIISVNGVMMWCGMFILLGRMIFCWCFLTLVYACLCIVRNGLVLDVVGLFHLVYSMGMCGLIES